MKVNGLNGTNTQAGMMGSLQATDSVSKNIQNQIERKQKELQELTSNDMLSVEEKMKKRQELQQEIADLNNQLRQHQMELRKKKQQTKRSSMDDMIGENRERMTNKDGRKNVGLSQTSMRAMISADSAMEQAKVQKSTATRMESRAGILESEIKMDAGRGQDVATKKQELAELEQKAAKATYSQMNTLVNANKELEAAGKVEQQAEKTDKTKEKEIKIEKKGEDSEKKQNGKVISLDKGTEVSNMEVLDVVETITTDMEVDSVSIPEKDIYRHINILL